MGKNQHVIPQGSKWAVKGAGNSKSTLVTNTQFQTKDVAKQIAQNQKSELVIHNRQGQIREKNTYSTDIYPPKG